jgi:hypothetical protein
VILLVGDPKDEPLVKWVLEAGEVSTPVEVVHTICDRDEAVHYLAGEGRYSDRAKHPLPNIIVVDAKVGGLDLVHWILGQPKLAAIPVVRL